MDEALPFLERAHLLLLDALRLARDAGSDVGPLEFALGRIYYALDGRYDPLACTREARASLGPLGEGESTRAVDQQLADAERMLALLAFRAPTAPNRLLVSHREPQWYAFDRPVILPRARTSRAPPPAVETMALPPSFVVAPLPALSLAQWTRQRQEDLFGEICSLLAHRIPQLDESWRGASFVEQRLLRDLDALVALDPTVLGELEGLVLDAAAPDPALLCGLAFVGGCLQGRDGLAMADRVRHHFESEMDFVLAWQDGLALTPHRGAAAMLRAYASDAAGARRASALAVLARRGEARAAELLHGCFDEDVVCAAALVPFVLSGDARAREVLDELQWRVERSPDAALREAFTTAAALIGAPVGRAWAEQAMRNGESFGARLFGICSERRDAELLLDWTATQPTAALVDALGWAGDPECMALLIGLLQVDDESIVVSAAAALERLTGAGLRQMFAISAEGVLTAEPTAPTPALISAGDSRDPAPEPTADRIELPSRDPEAWRAHWLAHESSLVPHVRTRRGVPYSPAVGVYELDRIPCTPRDRRTLHAELVVRSGLVFSFDTEAFVPQQEHRLAALQPEMQARSGAPGSWDRPLGRALLAPLTLG